MWFYGVFLVDTNNPAESDTWKKLWDELRGRTSATFQDEKEEWKSIVPGVPKKGVLKLFRKKVK